MIFPPESIFELRDELAKKVDAGEITKLDAYRQALAVDPADPIALRFLADDAEHSGNRAEALNLAERLLLANPLSHEGYLAVGRLLEDASLGAAYAALGEEKLHYDPESAAEYEPAAHPYDAEAEPERVTTELAPHRLIHELYVAGMDEIPRELVDRILTSGAETAPLLLGILNALGEDQLQDTDDAVAARALALLGGIGNPDFLPALFKFVTLEDETMGGAARWAFSRIAHRHPAETLATIQRLSVGAAAIDLAAYAQQLCLMPDVPGRKEALRALAVNLPELDGDDAALVVVSMITAAHVMEGKNSALAASIEAEHGSLLTREARKELNAIRGEIDAMRAELAENQAEPSIYDVVCEEFEAAEEEDDGPKVRQHPKVGRNDPCWCGSGKKYKKCHLEADAAH